MPEVNELPEAEVPGMPTPPVHEIPEFNGGVPGMPEVNDKPTSNIPEVPTQPNPNVPVQPVTPLTSNILASSFSIVAYLSNSSFNLTNVV